MATVNTEKLIADYMTHTALRKAFDEKIKTETENASIIAMDIANRIKCPETHFEGMKAEIVKACLAKYDNERHVLETHIEFFNQYIIIEQD